MRELADLQVDCSDYLRENRHLYAHKARRKKIALICVEAANRGSAEIRIDLGAAKLVVGKSDYAVEPAGVIIRKFSEFTWDFVVFAILDFHPVLILVDTLVFLTGPLYNRRLKRQLHLLSNAEMVLGPGDCKTAILGFRGVTKGPRQIQLPYRGDGGLQQQFIYDVPTP